MKTTAELIEAARQRYPRTQFAELPPEEPGAPDPALVARYPSMYTAEQRAAAERERERG